MARRKMKSGKILLAGLIAVGLGYLLGNLTLNFLLPQKDAEVHNKEPQVITEEEGQEFSERVQTQVTEERVQKAPIETSKEAESEQIESKEPPEAAPAESLWRVVVAGDAQLQEERVAQLKALGYATYPLPSGAIQLGVFGEEARAVALAKELEEQGFSVRVEETKRAEGL